MKLREREAGIREDILLLSGFFETFGNRGMSGITPKQLRLLETIASFSADRLTLSALAEAAGSTRQNIKKMTLLLERGGWIRVQKDERDQRILRIGITESGRNAIAQASAQRLENLEEAFAGLDEKTLKAVAKALARVKKNCQRAGRVKSV